jgi:DNA polymerase-3 subunit epsilon
MRQIVLDTETTGLEVAQGHRIIEIGCVELVDRRQTGNHLHLRLNPERDIDEGASAVHGMTRADLAHEPRFAEIAERLIGWLQGAELIIHNAAFDVGFLDAELSRAGRAERIADLCPVRDTLAMARQLHPGQKNNLDALCKRYGVDNSSRTLHGALLDAEILVDVYLAMTGGQAALSLDAELVAGTAADPQAGGGFDRAGLTLVVQRAAAVEADAHAARLATLRKASGGKCVWDQLEPPALTEP